ncbi:hypothetical protein MWU75_18650 [Ornithinimicrobium sp. F0845]|uniref:hypothetical protein n=1 Tax=Ornithinimicrobium sp. F0845 TaxID=2926412 RepID=UPI001FF546AF|nr:hypothetical protein [Ornithinimicrobium sp. F0845]MCK0114163.1 hypothetical protein [Ornithinimicrobium sp. F0845]
MADYRYNSPPNWPAPPEGWTPPKGWQPDPAWGPEPEGWEFWVRAAEEAGGRPNRNAWGRAAVVALIVTALLSIIPVVAGADNLAEVIGFYVGRSLVAYLATALWAFFSSRRWGWTRYAVTFVAITLVLGLFNTAGNV